MHEFSVMTQVVETILDELAKHDVVTVSEVVVDVGELTFLSYEALSFAWEVLTRENILAGTPFTINRMTALVRCAACGFIGAPEYLGDPADHFAVPILECPACKGKTEIARGREFIVRSIRFEERTADVVTGV